MSTIHLVPDDLRASYHVKEWRNATGILQTASPHEWAEIIKVLRGFRLLKSEVIVKGGRKSPVAKRIDSAFYKLDWAEKKFDTAITVDDNEYASPTHSVDCFKGRVGVEVEWNNKDPFYDRDLNNFRLLFDLRVLDVGVIVTRSTELQAIFKSLGKGAPTGRRPRTMRSCGPDWREVAVVDARSLPLRSGQRFMSRTADRYSAAS